MNTERFRLPLKAIRFHALCCPRLFCGSLSVDLLKVLAELEKKIPTPATLSSVASYVLL